MLDFLQNLRAGLYLGKITVQGRLAYAAWFFIDFVGALINFALTLLLWIYVGKIEQKPLPVPFNEFISFLSLATLINFAMGMWIDSILGERIRSGQVGTDLLKPMNFQWMYLFSGLSDVAVQSCISMACLALAFVILPQAPLVMDFAHLLPLALSLALAALVQYGVCFLLAMGAFVTHFGYGIHYLRLMSMQTFSGLFAPLSFYPAWLQSLSLALPFHCIIQTPAMIGLGWAKPNEIPGLLLEQALWAAGLIFAGQVIFRWLSGRLSVQGG